MNFPLRKGPTGPLVNAEDNPSVFESDSGFVVDVLPDPEFSGSVAALGAAAIGNFTLEDGLWYSTTVEVLLTSTIAPTQYVYRNQVELFRSGATAVLFYQPATVPVEQPTGSVYSVALSVSGNDFIVTLTNGAAAAVTYACYLGATIKPVP